MSTMRYIESLLNRLRTVHHGDMVTTEDYNLTKEILKQFRFMFTNMNVAPDLVKELGTWISKMPDVKYMEVVSSEDWNNRVEACRVLAEIIGRITRIGSVGVGVPDEWYPFSFRHLPFMSPTLKVVSLVYHENYWDEYVNYKQYVEAPETRYSISWKSYKTTREKSRPITEPTILQVTESDYTEKFSWTFTKPFDVIVVGVYPYFEMRSYDGKAIYAKWQVSDGAGGWIDVGGEHVETSTTYKIHQFGSIVEKTADKPLTPPLTIRLLAKKGVGTGGEIRLREYTWFFVDYIVHNFVGGAEYWFEVLRSYDKVRVKGQMQSYATSLTQAGVHIYFVKSGEDLSGKPERERLCIADRNDVEIVGHIFKPYSFSNKTLFFDHTVEIYDYVKYLVVLIDDPSIDSSFYASINELGVIVV